MKFKGIMPALITPLCEDESINLPVLDSLINHLISTGADGLYVGGATGEGLNLRTEQRMILSEASVKAVAHRVPVIVQVASTDFSDAVAIAKHAEACGADAVSATPPLFFKYDDNDVYNYYKALADAVHIPVMIYYNLNAGVSISADFAARMFEIDNITAIKWTSSDYYGMNRLKDITHGEMNIINGPDEMLLMGLAAGADGGIGSTYNIQLDIIKSIYTCFMNRDIVGAQAAQTRANRIIYELLKKPTIPAVKAVLEEMGFAVGNATFPMKRLSDSDKRELIDGLKRVGLVFPKK